MQKLFLAVIMLGLLVATCVGVGLYIHVRTPGIQDNKVIFIVQPGPFARIARELEDRGVVSNARWLGVYARLTGDANDVKVGEYELNTKMSPQDVLKVLTSGKSLAYPVTIQEGFNMYEIAALLEQRGLVKQSEFLRLCKDPVFIQSLLQDSPPTLEGYLFPNTYLFTRFMGAREILREMVHQFLEVYKEVEAGPQAVKMTRQKVVTLASIIEKETGVPEERGLVSSVFHNRLSKNMMLQTDPTVMYGVADQTGTMPKNIRKIDLVTPTRYNTYTFRGLPYGPISNPGRDSLVAALNPDTSEFLFFVSRNDGTHIFTKSYDQHTNAVKRFQMDSKQRQGKSWRDYSKKKR